MPNKVHGISVEEITKVNRKKSIHLHRKEYGQKTRESEIGDDHLKTHHDLLKTPE